MKATPTRTLNPLPFGDLEPHRFEDLVRQLAYEFRRWRSLEATGRLGADGGIDIRAIEIVPLDPDGSQLEDGDDITIGERLWVFQCKREKTLPPKRLRMVIDESLASLAAAPHGFVLAVACDVSAASRDAFRAEMSARGIEEFFIWGKSDLEDMLFQPKNDRLLFAYFGLALRPRRRDAATGLRSEIAKRKQLAAMMGEEADKDGTLILLRDPSDERYPVRPDRGEPTRWFLCRAVSIKKPGHLIVLRRKHLAAISADNEHWDAILDFDVLLWTAQVELRSKHAWGEELHSNPQRTPHDFWNEYIDEPRRAYLLIHRAIQLDRVLAIDPLGDGPYPVPHLLVEFTDTSGPFIPRKYARLVGLRGMAEQIHIDASDENRIDLFPKSFPDDDGAPPAAFDDTLPNAAVLPEQAASRLATLLPAAPTTIASNEGDHSPDQSHANESSERLEAFQQWCRAVAHPAFSSFVMSLRAVGHAARVIVRPAIGMHEPSSIEIRIRPRDARYLPNGHVRISCFAYMPEWRVDIAPVGRETQTRQSVVQPAHPSVTNKTTTDDLYALVFAAVERIKATGH